MVGVLSRNSEKYTFVLYPFRMFVICHCKLVFGAICRGNYDKGLILHWTKLSNECLCESFKTILMVSFFSYVKKCAKLFEQYNKSPVIKSAFSLAWWHRFSQMLTIVLNLFLFCLNLFLAIHKWQRINHI